MIWVNKLSLDAAQSVNKQIRTYQVCGRANRQVLVLEQYCEPNVDLVAVFLGE